MGCLSVLPARPVVLRCRLRPCRTSQDSRTRTRSDTCRLPALVPPPFRVPTVYLRTRWMRVMTSPGADSSRMLHFGTPRALFSQARGAFPEPFCSRQGGLCPESVTDGREAAQVLVCAVVFQTVHNVLHSGRLDKGCGPDLHRGRACHDEFEGVLPGGDATDPDDGNVDGACHLPDHTQRDWLDAGTGQARRDVVEDGLARVD